jgi:nitrogenase subunit NifH
MKHIPGFAFIPGTIQNQPIKGGSILQNRTLKSQSIPIRNFKKSIKYTLIRICPKDQMLEYYFHTSDGEILVEIFPNSQEADRLLDNFVVASK